MVRCRVISVVILGLLLVLCFDQYCHLYGRNSDLELQKAFLSKHETKHRTVQDSLEMEVKGSDNWSSRRVRQMVVRLMKAVAEMDIQMRKKFDHVSLKLNSIQLKANDNPSISSLFSKNTSLKSDGASRSNSTFLETFQKSLLSNKKSLSFSESQVLNALKSNFTHLQHIETSELARSQAQQQSISQLLLKLKGTKMIVQDVDSQSKAIQKKSSLDHSQLLQKMQLLKRKIHSLDKDIENVKQKSSVASDDNVLLHKLAFEVVRLRARDRLEAKANAQLKQRLHVLELTARANIEHDRQSRDWKPAGEFKQWIQNQSHFDQGIKAALGALPSHVKRLVNQLNRQIQDLKRKVSMGDHDAVQRRPLHRPAAETRNAHAETVSRHQRHHQRQSQSSQAVKASSKVHKDSKSAAKSGTDDCLAIGPNGGCEVKGGGRDKCVVPGLDGGCIVAKL